MTEQEITKIAMGTLRNYYRLRLKTDNPVLETNKRGAGGIIADGSYSFDKPDDGGRFLATVEATSVASSDEVYYKLQRWLLGWDSAAAASVLTAIWFVWTYVQGWLLVKAWGVWLAALVLVGGFVATAAIIALVLRNFRRYRYIYAIEQFKRYHADEQWIAVAEEVFTSSGDKRYVELRDQCIYNGCGLIVINAENRPAIVLTPARHELFGNTRKLIQLFSEKQIQRILQRSLKPPDWWQKFSKGLPLRLDPDDPAYFLRFRRPVVNQIMVCTIAWVAISVFFYLEWQQRPVRYLDQAAYAAEVNATPKVPEPNRTIILPSDSVHIRPFDNNVIPYLLLLQMQKPTPALAGRTGQEFLIGLLDNTMIMYDCERLYNFQATKYMLQEGIYPDFETATRRMSELLRAGLQANSLWLGCFAENDSRYVVYLDLFFDKRAEADSAARNYNNQLKIKRLNVIISVRTLLPKRG